MTEFNAPTDRFSADYQIANRIEWNDVDVQNDVEGAEPVPFVLFEISTNPKGCACGCGLAVTNTKRNFLPGHDQRLMGILVRAEREGLEVSWMSGGLMISGSALQYGQTCLNDQGVAKLSTYLATEPKRKSRRAAQTATADAEVKAPADPLPSTVKIGRWEYPVVGITRDGNGTIVEVEFKAKDGSTQTTTKWGSLV